MQISCLKVADIELPREVSGLYELAYNFWWSWSPRARRLFNTIDPVGWSEYHNPVQMLINVDAVQWENLLQSDTFMASYHSVMKEFREYVDPDAETWYRNEFGEPEWSPRTDVWPIGLIAFYLLTGKSYWRQGLRLSNFENQGSSQSRRTISSRPR